MHRHIGQIFLRKKKKKVMSLLYTKPDSSGLYMSCFLTPQEQCYPEFVMDVVRCSWNKMFLQGRGQQVCWPEVWPVEQNDNFSSLTFLFISFIPFYKCVTHMTFRLEHKVPLFYRLQCQRKTIFSRVFLVLNKPKS